MVEAATEFRKNSFNDQDSATLAKVATMFQNVADESMSAADSASFIIAQMKAFNIEADDAYRIIDSVNAVSNNFAVSSGDLANNLGNMSAAMATGNNTFEQSLGMLTAMTEITRSAAKGSRAMITVQGRLNQVVDESSDTGKKLTEWYQKHQIAIKDDEGQVRSLYEVLKDVAKIWPELTKNEQMYYLQQQAGTTQTQNLAALLSNFQTAIDATTTALESNGSAMKENESYMESLEAKEQSLKAEFEDFSNRVLSKEFVGGLVDAGHAMLSFANNDVGAAVVRVAGFSAALTSLVGIAGTVIGKISQLSSALSAAGGASGVIGTLLAPKTLLIIAGVATAIGLLAEVVKAVNQAIENSKFENLEKQAEELTDQVNQTKNNLDEAKQKLNELNAVPESDRADEWRREREELQQTIDAYEFLLDLRKQEERAKKEQAYSADVSGMTQAQTITDDEGYGRFLTGELMSDEQVAVATAQYNNLTEAIKANAKEFSEYFDEKSRIAIAEAIEAGDFDKAIQLERRALQMLGITFRETTQTAEEFEASQGDLMSALAQEVTTTKNFTDAQKEQYEAYVELNQGRYEFLSTQNELNESEQAFIDGYRAMTAAFLVGNRQFSNDIDLLEYLAKSLNVSSEEAYKLAREFGLVDTAWRELRADLYGIGDVANAVSETTSEVDSYIDALNEYRQANQDTVDSNGILVQSLFDSNGQLTETGRQALQTSDSMASMAKTFIEAQQAQAQADFSALILAIQEVGSQASITASQIASMMSMAGVSISGVETEAGSAKFKGWLSAQLGRAATNQDVLDYIRQQGEANYKKKMDEYKNQLSQIGGYVSSGAKSTAKNVENTAKQATDNIANYAKEQAEAVSQEIEDMFSKLRDTEEDYWDAKIDALEEQNKEIDRQVQLEEKLKALEEAKNQKVLLYKDGRFQYDTNRAAVASAQYDLNKTWIDVSLDKQKDILTKMKNGALDLIDEWKEKALEQGELTAEDINTLLGEYHDLGNAQYETVAWGTAGISNLIGTGMSVIGNAIAKSKLGQQLGLGNLNQQLANAGAFSGLYTGSDLRSGGTSGAVGAGGTGSYVGGGGTTSTGSVADLLNKNFGAGLTPTGTGGGTTKATGKIPTYRSQYGTTTWGGKDLNAPSTTTTALKGIRESYVEDAIKYGAGIAWWIQRMTPTNDYLGPGSYGETYESLLNTDWQSRAFGAKSAEELMDYMQRSAAQKIIGGYDGDINEWYDKTSLDAYRALYFRDPKAAIGNLYTDPDYRLYDALLFSKYFGKEGEIPDFETAGKKAFSGAFEESGPLSIQQLRQSAAVGSGGMSEWATGKILELSVKTQLEQLEAIDKQLEENDARQKTASGEELKQLQLLNKELTGTRKDIIDNFGKYETGVASWDVYGQPTVEREERWATDEELEAIGVTRPSRAKALQAQIDSLSAAWWATDDPDEKAKLHRQAEALRAELADEALKTAAMDIDGTVMTDEERYDMMRAQLAENSQAWFNADDAEKARLHDENEAIRKQLEDAGQSYARGTTYARGGLSLVGEDGPEMRVLGKGDGIIPSDVTSNLWKFGQNPRMFMRSYGQSLSNMFNISNLTLPNVHDAQSLVSGLERMAHQYVAQRS